MPKQIYDLNCPALASTKKSMDMILSYLCENKGIDTKDVKSKSRKAELVSVRVEFSKRCVRFATLVEVGNYLNRDHTSIIHYLKGYA